jgi:hypothetical protein
MPTTTVPGGGGGTLTFTFQSDQASLAQQIAGALAAASNAGTLEAVNNYAGGPISPPPPSGETVELFLNPTIGGSISVPSVAGAREILVADSAVPVTVNGNAGLTVSGANANVTVNDPALIVDAPSAETVNAGSGRTPQVFGATRGPGMDFIGGWGHATVGGRPGSAFGGSGTTLFGASGSHKASGAHGSLTFVAGSRNETLSGSGGGPSDTIQAAGHNKGPFLNAIMSVAGSHHSMDVITSLPHGGAGLPGGPSVSGAAATGGKTTMLSDNTRIEFHNVSDYARISNRLFNV